MSGVLISSCRDGDGGGDDDDDDASRHLRCCHGDQTSHIPPFLCIAVKWEYRAIIDKLSNFFMAAAYIQEVKYYIHQPLIGYGGGGWKEVWKYKVLVW